MDLLFFLKEKMHMQYIYQPVMIKSLLMNKGLASTEVIAKEILSAEGNQSYDNKTIKFIEKIINNQPGRFLLSHNIVSRNENIYELNEFSKYTENEIQNLINECEKKINEKRNTIKIKTRQFIPENRKQVPGRIRFEVLKRANGRCELCGTSDRELVIDHIKPKSRGGEDSINNYQALCVTCNSQKQDNDDTDFRKNKKEFNDLEKDCPFCNIDNRKIINEKNLAFAIYDLFPVTEYHLLIVPKRHVSEYFDLFKPEINEIHKIIKEVKAEIEKKDKTITGYNIGINNGEDAGQTIPHCHIHLIPRRKGDVIDPIGGIRNIIPGKGNY